MITREAELDCIICLRARKHLLKYDLGNTGIYKCLECGMMTLHPRPSRQELEEVYSDDYFENTKFFGEDGRTQENLYGYYDYFAERFNKQFQLNALAKELYAEAKKGGPDERPVMLEFGCGMGFFLDIAHDQGFEVHGLEFNKKAVKYMKDKYRFDIVEGMLPEAGLQPGRYDVVCAFDVIEHLDKPAEVVRQVSAALKPGGVFAISTMNSSSVVSRLLGKRLEDFRRTKEHLYFFDEETIRRFFAQHNLEVTEIRSVGHTFRLDFLLMRLDLLVPVVFKVIRKLMWPRWLLNANLYINPGTKMLVKAVKR